MNFGVDSGRGIDSRGIRTHVGQSLNLILSDILQTESISIAFTMGGGQAQVGCLTDDWLLALG